MFKYLPPALLIILVLLSCEKANENDIPDITPQHKSFVKASNAFGFDLFQETLDEDADKDNIVLSPLSVSMALGMLLNGAETTTEDGILQTMRLSNDSEANQLARDLLDFLPQADPLVESNIANSIWYREDFDISPQFLSINQSNYDAAIEALDFSDPNAKDLINAWVESHTNGKIPTIINQINPSDIMFLINAVYFNAPWTEEFDPQYTYTGNFTKEDGNNIQTDIMMSSEINYSYYSNNLFQLINLPYGNGSYQFTAILPNNNLSVNEIAEELSVDNWSSWQSSLMPNPGFHLYFPKFELAYEIKLKEVLSTMGMAEAFTNAADLSGIHPTADLFVSRVVHKTYMKVNEEGTEAAAATSIGVGVTSAPPTLYFNKPFIIVIHEEETGAILFIGKIGDPSV